MMLIKFKKVFTKFLGTTLAAVMAFSATSAIQVQAATYSLTTTQYADLVKVGHPANYPTRTNDIYSAFITDALPLLRTYGLYATTKASTADTASFNAFKDFSTVMGTIENTTLVSKISRALYNEISDHNSTTYSNHTTANCISEMKAMADTLRNRAIGKYSTYGSNISGQMDGDTFNNISGLAWKSWGGVTKTCIVDACGGGDRTYKAIVMAFAFAKIMDKDYNANKTDATKVTRFNTDLPAATSTGGSKNYYYFFDGRKTSARTDETIKKIGEVTFSNKVGS